MSNYKLYRLGFRLATHGHSEFGNMYIVYTKYILAKIGDKIIAASLPVDQVMGFIGICRRLSFISRTVVK